jgi:hypothetical protein
MGRKRGGDIKVVIAGAYTLDPALVAPHVLLGEEGAEGWGGLSRLPIGASVLLRHPLSGPPGPVEEIVATLCEALSIPVHWRAPEPGRGGTGTIERDADMVEEADAVVTYIDTARTDEGGTLRVQRMGFQKSKPSWSFAPIEEGMAYIGASERVPAWAT